MSNEVSAIEVLPFCFFIQPNAMKKSHLISQLNPVPKEVLAKTNKIFPDQFAQTVPHASRERHVTRGHAYVPYRNFGQKCQEATDSGNKEQTDSV